MASCTRTPTRMSTRNSAAEAERADAARFASVNRQSRVTAQELYELAHAPTLTRLRCSCLHLLLFRRPGPECSRARLAARFRTAQVGPGASRRRRSDCALLDVPRSRG